MKVQSHRCAVIIDEAPESADLFQIFLSVRGYDARIAQSGAHGMELIMAFRPQIVICDDALPDMDSGELARAVRAFSGEYDPFLVSVSPRSDFSSINSGACGLRHACRKAGQRG
jgi:DNA-binding response OmpR family regulator